MYFAYADEVLDYLKERDPKLGQVILRLGRIEREVNPDLCSAVIEQILGQQISTKAYTTVRARFYAKFGELNARTLAAQSISTLKELGISLRKATYIQDFCQKVSSGEFELHSLTTLSDQEVITRLTSLKGIGVWTAQMLLLFSLQRSDILCYEDLGIQRGMRMVYQHSILTRSLFNQYRQRLSPYGSVASLYFWAVSGGALDSLQDPGGRV